MKDKKLTLDDAFNYLALEGHKGDKQAFSAALFVIENALVSSIRDCSKEAFPLLSRTIQTTEIFLQNCTETKPEPLTNVNSGWYHQGRNVTPNSFIATQENLDGYYWMTRIHGFLQRLQKAKGHWVKDFAQVNEALQKSPLTARYLEEMHTNLDGYVTKRMLIQKPINPIVPKHDQGLSLPPHDLMRIV